MKKIRKFSALAFAFGMTFGLAACGEGDTSAPESPTQEQTQEQGSLTEEPDYKDTYAKVKQTVIDNYGINETVALCDQFKDFSADNDFDALIDGLMEEAQVTYDDEALARDATYDVLEDVCANHTPAG